MIEAVDILPFACIFDVGINEQTVHFRMDILDRNLKPVETTGFGDLHFRREFLHLNEKERSVHPTIEENNG